jgi:hypothetical protein
LAAIAVVVALGLFAGQARAAAPNNCDQSSFTVAVAFIGEAEGNIMLTAQLDGTSSGPVTVRVFCNDQFGTDIGEVLNSKVTITTGFNATFDGQPSGTTFDLPTGIRTLTVVSTDPGLAPGVFFAKVGEQTTAATVAFGQTIPAGSGPKITTSIFARTPELSSIALLASGGAGALGYLALRARSRRRK